MSLLQTRTSYRILVVDDNAAIHSDFAKILHRDPDAGRLDAMAAALFSAAESQPPGEVAPEQAVAFRVDFASQGQEAVELVRAAQAQGDPYAVAFVDMRMPPGWDGLQTIQEMWQVSDEINAVICTAYSDMSLAEVARTLGRADRLLILKKPFEGVEAEQIALSMCEKWRVTKERTRYLDQVTRARATAEAAAEARAAFLANMSHEIRTPLTAILGYADLLRDRDVTPRLRLECLDTIAASGNHLLRIVSDVLDMAKIEADRVEFEQVDFSPTSLLRQVIGILQVAAANKKVSLDLVTEGEFPLLVLGDVTRIQQVLFNLVSNALKFTEHGGVIVRGQMHRPARAPAELVVEVEDTGIGMAPQVLEKLFTVFVQGEASTTRRFGGSGLGLVIARRLARAMGGDITVRSEVGKGSCFRFLVPLVVVPGVTWAEVGAERRDPEIGLAEPSPVVGRVLVVDDARDVNLLLTRYLEKAGATVIRAEDGETGLAVWCEELAAGRPLDLVVTDVQMPKMDGRELARALRRHGCRVPIVALSASVVPEDRELALQSGCSAYLGKPINRSRFLELCASLLNAKKVV